MVDLCHVALHTLLSSRLQYNVRSPPFLSGTGIREIAVLGLCVNKALILWQHLLSSRPTTFPSGIDASWAGAHTSGG